MSDNNVVFKGSKDGIIILLDKEADFDSIKAVLSKKIVDAKKFFGDYKAHISFKGRELTEKEENELIDIISSYSDLNIAFVDSQNLEKTEEISAQQASAEIDNSEIPIQIEEKIEHHEEETSEIEEEIYNMISADQNDTLFHKGSLRSGQVLNHAGSVVIIGDVNPGSEIAAEGNVIVLGAAKGVIHAGCGGNFDCFVAALNLQPVQLRISEVITYIPKEEENKSKKKTPPVPSLAYTKNRRIYIRKLL